MPIPACRCGRTACGGERRFGDAESVRTRCRVIFEAHDLRVCVAFPRGSELDQVKAAVGAEFHFYGALEGELREETADGEHIAFVVQLNSEQCISRPFEKKKCVVEFTRKFVR